MHYSNCRVWKEESSATMTKIQQASGEIKLTQSFFKNPKVIKRKEPTMAQRTIGIRICPEGGMGTEFKYRVQ